MQAPPSLRPLTLSTQPTEPTSPPLLNGAPATLNDSRLRLSAGPGANNGPSLGVGTFSGDIFAGFGGSAIDPYGNPGQMKHLKRTRLLLSATMPMRVVVTRVAERHVLLHMSGGI